MSYSIGIIASDLTGAMDTGAAFAESPHEAVVHFDTERVPSTRIAVVVTDSASAPPAEAYARTRRAAARLAGRALFKKMDSTLRGNVGPELRAVLDEAGTARAVVCPALPRQGRTVREGVALLHGVPVHLTAYGSHPVTPCRDSDIRRLLSHDGTRCCLVGLDIVRGGSERLRQALASAEDEVAIVDAETDADLLTLARALPAGKPGWLACGSSGLATAMATVHGRRPDVPLRDIPAAARSALAVIGSRNPVTVEQVETLAGNDGCSVIDIDADALCSGRGHEAHARWREQAADALAHGRAAVLTTSRTSLVPELRAGVAQQLGDLTAAVAEDSAIGMFVLSGGATAWAACRSLGMHALDVLGEQEPGVVEARAQGGACSGTSVLTKAGGFGDAGTLARALCPQR